jgi:glycosyltransferase involved in cell wall biosynthesis
MKKKIVLLITSLHYGGMERVAFIAYYLLRDVYEVEIVTLYTKDADYQPEFDFLDLKCPPKKSRISKVVNVIKRTNAVRKMKKELKPDIVMSFGTSANFANSASKGEEKIIIGIRSFDWITDYFATYSIDKWVYNKADIVCSVSNVIAEEAENVFNIDRAKSRVLYNPYDINYINEKAKELVTDVDVIGKGPLIISVGRLVNQKGYNHLIKSFLIVLKEFPEAQLMIIGHGEKESELIQLISDLDIEKHVLLMGGQDNPYKYMRIADLYVLSSITEGFPNAMVEAMSVGLPVVAVDCKSGPREILSNVSDYHKKVKGIEICDYGIMVSEVSKSFNYDANHIEDCDYELANGIIHLLRNQSLQEEFSRKSVERAREFTYEKFKYNLVNMFDCL